MDRRSVRKILYGTFSLHLASGSPRPGCSSRLIWCRTLDLKTPFCSKQIRGTRDLVFLWGHSAMPNPCFRKRHPYLLITSKESQLAIQFFHYRLPLFPAQLCAVSPVNIWYRYHQAKTTFRSSQPLSGTNYPDGKLGRAAGP